MEVTAPLPADGSTVLTTTAPMDIDVTSATLFENVVSDGIPPHNQGNFYISSTSQQSTAADSYRHWYGRVLCQRVGAAAEDAILCVHLHHQYRQYGLRNSIILTSNYTQIKLICERK